MMDKPEKGNTAAERVREEERRRLARYLHDHIGQILSFAQLQLTRIQRTLRAPLTPDKQAWLQTTVDSLVAELNTAAQAVQEEVFLLDPSGLHEVGFIPMLEQECGAFSQRTGIPCHRRFDPIDIAPHRSAALLLILREALSNIARHSGASSADVMLQRSGEHVVLRVCDNGIGFDPIRLRAPESFGVRGMEERARAVGAEVRFDRHPSDGSQLTVVFPLHCP
jgi:two-component system sensor histidine kinase UhpB